MNLKAKLALLWVTLMVGLDIGVMAFMLMNPDSGLYALAAQFKWNINPTWIGTTLATVIFMAIRLEKIWRIGVIVPTEKDAFQAIAVLWAAELIIYESAIGLYHPTKILDALRWLSVALAIQVAYVSIADELLKKYGGGVI